MERRIIVVLDLICDIFSISKAIVDDNHQSKWAPVGGKKSGVRVRFGWLTAAGRRDLVEGHQEDGEREECRNIRRQHDDQHFVIHSGDRG